MALEAEALARAMETELGILWEDHFDYDLPDAGASQRHLFFLAIARGILNYLAGEAQSVSTITLQHPEGHHAYYAGPWNVSDMQWNVSP